MPFFLPSRLVELKYLTGEPDPEFEALAKSYLDDIDFAFFVAEFGYTRSEYEELTPRQVNFIKKAWEDREVRQTNLINMAVNNSLANLHRKKGRSPIPLWQKAEKVDVEKAKDHVSIIKAMDKRDGDGWIKKIWAANRRTKRGNGK